MAIEVGCNRSIEKDVQSLGSSNGHHLEGICAIVDRIDQIQKEALLEDPCITCTAERLGNNSPDNNLFNTRPFSLYLPNGEKLAIDIIEPTSVSVNNRNVKSDLFRVESMCDCIATLRALTVVSQSKRKIVATCFCCSVNLEAFVCIQCFEDTYIKNLNCLNE